MANEEKVELEDEIEELPQIAEGQDDTTDYKALAAKNAGIAKRFKTKFEKSKIAKGIEKGVEKALENKQGFDNADKALLVASGIKLKNFDIVQKYVDAGKSLDDILDEDSTVGKLVLAEIKDRTEAQATKEAVPSGSKRSATSPRDSVDYHIAKGTPLSQIPDRKLRSDIVKARYEAEKNVNQFTDHPVA